MNYQTDLKLCTITSHRLLIIESYRYSCGMCTELCQEHKSHKFGAIISSYYKIGFCHNAIWWIAIITHTAVCSTTSFSM